MPKPQDAKATMADPAKAEAAIRHVVHDYTILLWCRWAVQQTSTYAPIVRSHLAFSYFLPYRAFADFFSNERFVPKDMTTADVDVHAVDFSDHVPYVTKAWDNWLPHMNTHLFHINYYRTRSRISFDSTTVINAIHPEFETNWNNFIQGLRGDFPELFRKAIDARRADFPELTL